MRHPAVTTSRVPEDRLAAWFPWARDRAAYIDQSWWEDMGDWSPAEPRFSGGFAAFVERLRARRMGLGLWFDPRIHTASPDGPRWDHACAPSLRRHPRDMAWDAGLIDTGRAEGRRCLRDLHDRLVALGATLLWHDLNSEPQGRYWGHHDEPGRRGLAELRYWAGLFAVYDDLIARHPQVLVEWCGSGGTMINLGILRRAHLMWLTDKADLRLRPGATPDAARARAVRSGVLWMLPADRIIHTLYPRGLEACAEAIWPEAVVQLGSVLAYGQTLAQASPAARADLARVVAVYRRIRHLLGKEFWGLAEGAPPREDAWDGWQFHDPQTGCGVLILFRPAGAPATWTIQPRWLPSAPRWEPLLGDAQVVGQGAAWQVQQGERAAVIAYAPPA
jgi:alpha-galactosidase